MEYADIKYSKELKDWFPESEWWYVKLCTGEFMIGDDGSSWTHGDKEKYPALTTDMLLERLPARLRLEDADYWLQISPLKEHVAYDIRYRCFRTDDQKEYYKTHHNEQGESLPNALAKMLLYLIKEGLVTNG